MSNDVQQYKRFLNLLLEEAKTGCTNYIKREWRASNINWYFRGTPVLQHVIQTTKCSEENSLIFTMDNHPIHISLNTLKLTKDHEVDILALPSHTSHTTQPFDGTIFGPLKFYFNSSANSWMTLYLERNITI